MPSPRTAESDRAYLVPAGPSIIDKLWKELEFQVGKMLSLKKEGWGPNDSAMASQAGHCLGLAKALAMILKPYDPDINEVRREVMRRIREAS